MACKISDKIIEFAEERGGMSWYELVEYSMNHDERWFKYFTGPNAIRVRFEVGVRGWDSSITPDDIHEDLSDMMEGDWGFVSKDAVLKLFNEILLDPRFVEWEKQVLAS